MARRKMRRGKCRICRKTKDLSFEHIPPSAAFNKHTKFRSIPYLEAVQDMHDPNYKPTAKLQQGGLGDYVLCRDCNSFLGNQYVPTYVRAAGIGMHILRQYPTLERVELTIENLSGLRLLKQAIAIFICLHDERFTAAFPELLDFVKNPTQNELPEKYRVMMYLNREGLYRNLNMTYHNHYGLISEMTFPPFGFLIKLDDTPSQFPYLTEITHFKNLQLDNLGPLGFELYKLPTFTLFPADYRTEAEIAEQVKKSEELMKKGSLNSI